jgi:hypothetical protein
VNAGDGSPARESHWLDRLALRLTRRQALKAAAAGAAVSAFPLLRAAPALADDPHACQQGCLWTSHQTVESGRSGCALKSSGLGLFVIGYGPLLGAGLFGGGAAGTYVGLASVQNCLDGLFAQAKADNHDCLQPNCPGFDPKQENGPCEGVTDNCCPCASVVSGYIPCIYPCGDPNHNCCPTS